MSLRLEMLQVARLAPTLLGEAAENVAGFLATQLNDDGGAKDRAGNSDLYYTVFLLEGFLALQETPPIDRVLPYVQRFGDGPDLDFVHLTCLARCIAVMPDDNIDDEVRGSIAARLEAHRSADGGYASTPGGPSGSVYNAFLAFGAYQDLRLELPDRDALIANVEAQRTDDGAFTNGVEMPIGNTPATAAAATILRNAGRPTPTGVGEWLLARCSAQGGFLVMPEAPMPDLLSTATALHALGGLQVPIEPIRERCLDFVDSLWTGKGFCGHWSDDVEDCEYTYYGLLAAGHLSL